MINGLVLADAVIRALMVVAGIGTVVALTWLAAALLDTALEEW